MSDTESPRRRFVIPIWVGIAAMILALAVAGIVIAEIAEPLVNLIFPGDPEIPLPDDIELLDERDDGNYASNEWLYGSEAPGCEIAQFFASQDGVTCTVISSAGCGTPDNQPNDDIDGFYKVGDCNKSVDEVAASYSWRVEIFDGYVNGPRTQFRVYLFSERE